MKRKDILQLESSNIQQAYLFEEKGQWYAYEHSANRIENFIKGFVKFGRKKRDFWGRVKVEIDLKIIEICPIKSCEDSILILDFPT